MALELNKIRSSQINEKISSTHYDIIYPETRADLVKETFGAKATEWKAQTKYIVGDTVYVQDSSGSIASYECISEHTSGNSFNIGNEWSLILSRRFITPQDEINWNEGGIALKFRGAYSPAQKYKQHDLVVYKNATTGQEEYFISLVGENQGVTPSFEGHNSNWQNLNLWATHSVDTDKIRVTEAPVLTDSADSVYLTFVTENDEEASLYTKSNLVYEVNSNYLHVLSEYADKYMRAFNAEGADITPVEKSLNDEFKAIYASLRTISSGGLVLGHSLTIKLNGNTLLQEWKAERDATVELNLTHESITDWDTAMNEAFSTVGDTKYVRYDAAQTLTVEQQTQARTNINAAPIANYPIMGDDNKIKLENLPDTVVGGLQYKGTFDPSNPDNNVTPEVGDYYIATADGNYDPAGGLHASISAEITYYRVGDWAIYDGEAGWSKVDNTDAVRSVNGQIGDVNTYKGVWSNKTEYFKGDWVLENDTLYLAIANSTNQDPKAANSTYWKVAGRVYVGDKGIVVSGNVISHSAEHKTEATENKTIDANGGNLVIDINQYDAQGHVTNTKQQNITLSQTWREVKVGDTIVTAANANDALNVVGTSPISVAGNAENHSITISHELGAEVKDAIAINVTSTGQASAQIAASNTYGHVIGTRELKLTNLAIKDGDQILSGIKTYKNNGGLGAVILPETTDVYDIGSASAKFKNIYAININGHLVGSADSADKWTTGRELSISINSGSNGLNGELIGPKVTKIVDGASNVSWAVTLADTGVKAGVYSAVQVNSKGIVLAGAQILEFGTVVNADPQDSLAIGGLFFRLIESN